MFLNPSLCAALDLIAQRAADVRRAFTPGAAPERGDVAAFNARSDVTLDPLSVALPNDGYAAVTDERGRTAYTRNGTFSLTAGRLVDAAGRPVLGRIDPGAPLGELRIDPVDAALGRIQNARIEADGSLVYSRAAIDPRTGKRDARNVVVGRIALARFPAGTKLDTIDGRTFRTPSGVVPLVGAPGDGTFETLVPMRRERSGVDLDASLMRLKEAYVAFDALTAAEQVRARLSKAAMDVVK